MCGRYTLTFIFEGLAEVFNAIIDNLQVIPPRYNVAPTQIMPVITRQQGINQIQAMRWGLVPSWAKDINIGSKMINARLETVSEKPAYKSALYSRRCLVPADGYYEWQPGAGNKPKQPYRIVAPERQVFAFAGLWEVWPSPAGLLQSFTILTTEAQTRVADIHDRMPLILPKRQEDYWLDGPARGQAIADFLAELKPENNLYAYPVSSLVNSPANDSIDCIKELNQIT